MIPKIPYLVCSTRRSGSTLLCFGLKELSYGIPDEYFNAYSLLRNPVFSKDAQALEEFLNETRKKATSQNNVCGAKVHWEDFKCILKIMRTIEIYKGMSDAECMSHIFPGLKYIHIRRRDKIKQAISFEKAIRTNQWLVEKNVPAASPKSLNYDYYSLFRRRKQLIMGDRGWIDFFRRSSIRPLEVTYEDMILDYRGTLKRVLEYLELPVPSDKDLPDPPLQRQSDEINENWYERFNRTPKYFGFAYVKWRGLQNRLEGLKTRTTKHEKAGVIFNDDP